MDQSHFIGAHLAHQNTALIRDKHAEDTFYNEFDKDHLGGLKSAAFKSLNYGRRFVALLRVPAVVIPRKA